VRAASRRQFYRRAGRPANPPAGRRRYKVHAGLCRADGAEAHRVENPNKILDSVQKWADSASQFDTLELKVTAKKNWTKIKSPQLDYEAYI
jgi:hypothetical protein